MEILQDIGNVIEALLAILGGCKILARYTKTKADDKIIAAIEKYAMMGAEVAKKLKPKKKDKKLRVIWVKSSIGYSERQKGTIRALGLRRLGQSVEHKDTPVIRGMINRVDHLVEVQEVEK